MDNLIHADCLDAMAAMDAESIDAIVTDPPYGLEFMGKKWDRLGDIGQMTHSGIPDRDGSTVFGRSRVAYSGSANRRCRSCSKWEWGHTTGDGGGGGKKCECASPDFPNVKATEGARMQDWHEAWAREAFRIAKPGAHLLAFGGTRTVHRLAAAIEDAGWEIRDTLVWGYASGFPKSLDVSKAIDKAAGAEREVTGVRSYAGGHVQRSSPDHLAPPIGTFVRTQDDRIESAPATPDAEKWNGWGTALKPAWEPIVMARKPLRGSVAANVLAHGTGALNIDGTRIGTEEVTSLKGLGQNVLMNDDGWKGIGKRPEPTTSVGRWPANVILTDPIFDGGIDGVVGGGETTKPPAVASPFKSGGVLMRAEQAAQGYRPDGPEYPGEGAYREQSIEGYGDSGTYSRFFLVPKSSRSDREPIDPSYAYRLHRERGDCAKLSAWDSEDRRLAERMDSTSPARAISEAPSTDGSPSDMLPSGSPLTDPSPTATTSTTSTATSKITPSTTSSSLTPSPTNGSTPGANSETASGGSPATSAARSSGSANPTGISPLRDGPSTVAAAPVTSRGWSSRNNCAVCGKPLPRFSTHPTQKPTDLMRHLVRLVTPPGGIVLDPFLGSGTTAIAAEMEGFAWIGIEKEAEYVAIAEARLNGTQKGLGLVG